ncbi:MAG: hypothetical protein HY068_10650 [Burkholderiales bacterium]|nr:hypothetical protein [Burkholderiales bacterium]
MMACMVAGTMSVLVVKSGQRDFSDVQAQVEEAAIKTNLGGLRTAFAIDYLANQVAISQGAGPTQTMAGQQTNPFLLLHRIPSNYVGEMPAAEVINLPPGSWLFDPACACIAYCPLYPEWLSSPSGSSVLWFDVVGAPGPLQLTPREAYVWKGEALT